MVVNILEAEKIIVLVIVFNKIYVKLYTLNKPPMFDSCKVKVRLPNKFLGVDKIS